MPTLIIASTTPRAGKTALAAGLSAWLAKSGREVVVAKGWSADPAGDRDAAAFKALLPGATHVSPETAAGRPSITQARQLASRLRSAAPDSAVAVVEGGSGDTAPNLTLAEAVDGVVVLVGGLTDDIAAAARPYGKRLAGVVINNLPRYRGHTLESEVLPALKQAGVTCLGSIPEDRRLLAPSIGLVAEHLGAGFALLEEQKSRLIDNFLIGGLVLDWGPSYFGSRENTGVIVRGDRPDVQIAALQTDTTRALVLTKGIPPIEYVYYEARERDIPIAVSPYDTHETAARLESLLPEIGFDHPDKLARMAELMEERLDLPAIEGAIAHPATR